MKKKTAASLIMALFFAASGAFYIEGAPEKAIADEEKPETAQKSEQSQAAKAAAEDEKPVIKEESEKTEAAEEPEEADLAETIAEKRIVQKDTIKIGDRLYDNVMDDSKFSRLIKPSKKYGAKLYALAGTDLFVIAKDGKPIVYMSTGTCSASADYANLLAELFASGFEEYKKLQENILFSAETGAEISVKFEQYTAYSIKNVNGEITVSW
ncbi:hypothetical protein EVU96_15545 [Bacillus infantis]|uniref:hypothetical protein n=1 Tax=Bacillus infantis TaxID=324767 RepID=UPI00101BF1DF|nr:hypothetical protein [Bacillus infantis]RYI27872.1 hypothetical protein EVU96_15545 [Bacillus infantis]